MQISTAGHFGEWKMMIPFDGSSNLRRRGHCLEPKWGFLHRRDNYVSTTGLSEMELRSRQSAVSCGLWSAIFFSLFFYLFLGSFFMFYGDFMMYVFSVCYCFHIFCFLFLFIFLYFLNDSRRCNWIDWYFSLPLLIWCFCHCI